MNQQAYKFNKLDLEDLIALGVGGIFSVLGLSVALAGHAAPIAFALWGLIAFLTEFSYAKLGSICHSDGDGFTCLEQAFVNTTDLTIISSFASSTFLLVLAAINLSAIKLRTWISINVVIRYGPPLVSGTLSSFICLHVQNKMEGPGMDRCPLPVCHRGGTVLLRKEVVFQARS